MEFEQILKLVDHISASHLESFCYESDGVKLTLNNKIAPVIIPGTMQNNILSGAETGEKGFVYGEKYSISEQAPDRKMADKELSASEKKQTECTLRRHPHNRRSHHPHRLFPALGYGLPCR